MEADRQKAVQRQQRETNNAHWTKKHGKSFFGYKDHINVDNKHKLIQCWEVTLANPHDGHLLEKLLDPDNSSADVYADGAYRSTDNEKTLKDQKLRSKISRNKPRNKPMPKHIKRGNRTKSQIRARVEHVCGGIKQGATKQFVKSIGLPRATLRIGMKNMAYNIKRFKHLLSHVSVPFTARPRNAWKPGIGEKIANGYRKEGSETDTRWVKIEGHCHVGGKMLNQIEKSRDSQVKKREFRSSHQVHENNSQPKHDYT